MLQLLLACTDPVSGTTDSSTKEDAEDTGETGEPPAPCGAGTVHLYGSFTLDGDTLTGVYGAIGVLDAGNPFDPLDHVCSGVGAISATRSTVDACEGCDQVWDIKNGDPAQTGEACPFIDSTTWAFAAAPWTLGWYAESTVGSHIVDYYETNRWVGFAGNLSDPTAWPTGVVEREDGIDLYTAVQETVTPQVGDARTFDLPCE